MEIFSTRHEREYIRVVYLRKFRVYGITLFSITLVLFALGEYIYIYNSCVNTTNKSEYREERIERNGRLPCSLTGQDNFLHEYRNLRGKRLKKYTRHLDISRVISPFLPFHRLATITFWRVSRGRKKRHFSPRGGRYSLGRCRRPNHSPMHHLTPAPVDRSRA